MRFLYLIQGKAENVRKYSFLHGTNSKLIGLSYDEPEAGFEFFPNSSFATGRNYLLSLALPQLDEFDYLIFLDDDVVFRRGSFELMQENLSQLKPAIGVPLTEKTRLTALGFEFRGEVHPLFHWQKLHINDEQYLALSREVVREGLLLPYLTQWDQQSWFVCCLIQEALIQHYYFGRAWQFNNCEIRNDQHSGNYPHNLSIAQAEYQQWMKTHFPKGTKRPALYKTTWRLTNGIKSVAQNLCLSALAIIRASTPYRKIRGIRPW